MKRKILSIVLLLSGLSTFPGCDNKPTPGGTEATTTISETEIPASPSFSATRFEVKTFEVKDTLTKLSTGWGYDIYADNARMIHQPIIPAIQGNKSFPSEEKARKTGEFAVKKMRSTGTLPTLTIAELDSLDVTSK